MEALPALHRQLEEATGSAHPPACQEDGWLRLPQWWSVGSPSKALWGGCAGKSGALRWAFRRIHTRASINSSIGSRFFVIALARPAYLPAAMRVSDGFDQILYRRVGQDSATLIRRDNRENHSQVGAKS